jgi:hypothetical protein
MLDRFHKYREITSNREEQLFLTEKLRRQLFFTLHVCENGSAFSVLR